MPPLVQELNFFLSLGTILLQVVSIAFLADIFFFKNKYLAPLIHGWVREIALALVLFGVVLTLVYSELFGFVPCGLCWFERIFLYPQAILLGVALWRGEERFTALYGFILSSIGAIISLYHHYIQMGGSEFVKCPAAGADCTKRIIFEFGYITFPLMAFSLFVFLAIFYYTVLRTDKVGTHA
jgi:disulfide bond formation protein DsbB